MLVDPSYHSFFNTTGFLRSSWGKTYSFEKKFSLLLSLLSSRVEEDTEFKIVMNPLLKYTVHVQTQFFHSICFWMVAARVE